jgi:hypothetical protein
MNEWAKRVKRDKQPEWYNTEVQYARQMRDKFKKLDMWAAYKFWRKRTKQMLDEAKQNFYNNMFGSRHIFTSKIFNTRSKELVKGICYFY